ncbi:putative fructose-2,6-bisphosphatase TIGAR A [Aplochiton taeniatus]
MSIAKFALTIVRHGETQYNKDGLLQGQAIDSPLSDIGMQQAYSAGQYLKDVKFTNVFVSDMLRARQTAEVIVKHNSSCSGLEMVSDPLLKERSFGIAEGRRVEDMRNMAQAAGQSCPDFTPPEGETPEQVKLRVKGFLQLLFQRMVADHGHDGDQGGAPQDAPTPPVQGRADDGVGSLPAHALVVSHGAYIRIAVRYFVEELQCPLPKGSDMAHMFSLCPNTGICRFILTVKRSEDGSLAHAAISCVFVHRGDHVRQ